MNIYLTIILAVCLAIFVPSVIFMIIILIRNPIARMSYLEFHERLQYNIESIIAIVGETENVNPSIDGDMIDMEKKVLLKVEELYVDSKSMIKMLYGKDFLMLQSSNIYRTLRYSGKVSAIIKIAKGIK